MQYIILKVHRVISFYLRNPNSGKRTFPIIVDEVDSLPEWPRHTIGKDVYLDMGSYHHVTVKTNLRKKQCEFLTDPEGFTEEITSCAKTNLFTSISFWFITTTILAFSLFLIS